MDSLFVRFGKRIKSIKICKIGIEQKIRKNKKLALKEREIRNKRIKNWQ